MSADNFVGVRPNSDGTYRVYSYGCMSLYDEDCMYLKDESSFSQASSREEALVLAHDLVNGMDICEYGVIEMPPAPDKPCGRCYVCINERGIVAEDVDRCDHCNEPFSSSDWQVSKFDPVLEKTVTVHRACERETLLQP